MAAINFSEFTHLTFDCYGTLIDWESGILKCMHSVLDKYNVKLDDVEILKLYAKFEAQEESGDYKTYRNVLRNVMSSFAGELGFTASESDLNALPDSLALWPPFSDTIEALKALKKKYNLVILSNTDEALFKKTEAILKVEFDAVFTAERIGSYKPSLKNFRYALDNLGIGASKLLHVAQSIYHDHVPAKKLGIKTIWVNRESISRNLGIAPVADAVPDIEVPDLKSLVELINLSK